VDLVVGANGVLICGQQRYPCVLGRSGVRLDKHEGDGASPAGRFPLRRVLYRPDRVPPPITGLPFAPLSPQDGWCDAPDHPDYNRPVHLPHPVSCETLWREDHVYDVIVVLGHNDNPPQPGQGSAIFMHIARPQGEPTEGCVALSLADLLEILAVTGPNDSLSIDMSPL
jgi:L,D-peptidoglycan transpeptidase YkuD (ErfK/YbiS/YcfS/YnhG family)